MFFANREGKLLPEYFVAIKGGLYDEWYHRLCTVHGDIACSHASPLPERLEQASGDKACCKVSQTLNNKTHEQEKCAYGLMQFTSHQNQVAFGQG